MIVKAKSQEREAWRYTGQPQNEWPAWVQRCVRFTHQEGCGLILSRLSGRQWIHHGDWLVRDLDGDPEWLTHDMMRREYDEVRADSGNVSAVIDREAQIYEAGFAAGRAAIPTSNRREGE